MRKYDFTKSPVNGYYNKTYEDCATKLEELHSKRSTLQKEWKKLGDIYDKAPSSENLIKRAELNDELEKIEKNIKTLDIQIESGIYHLDTSYNEDPYTPSEIGFSLGDRNGRSFIGRKREHIPLDRYEETNTASEFAQGEEPETNFEDLLTMISTDEDDSIMFDSNIVYGLGSKMDDEKTFNNAIDHSHKVMLINAENKKACEILRSAKNPISMDVNNLQKVINLNLSAKAKKETIILLNHSGFAKLDIVDSVSGYPLVKRNTDGCFIYRDKYPILEIPDEILPNNEDGSSPVIIGDMNIVKFYVMREDRLIRDGGYNLKINDRTLKREIITLSTTSNKAYIHGSI